MAEPVNRGNRKTKNLVFDPEPSDNDGYKNERVLMMLLQDIRDELRQLNQTLTEASIFVNGKVGNDGRPIE